MCHFRIALCFLVLVFTPACESNDGGNDMPPINIQPEAGIRNLDPDTPPPPACGGLCSENEICVEGRCKVGQSSPPDFGQAVIGDTDWTEAADLLDGTPAWSNAKAVGYLRLDTVYSSVLTSLSA